MTEPSRSPWRRPELLALALICALGLAARLVSFGDSLFGDELSALFIVSGHGFGQMMHLLNGHSSELNPPLFFILSWFSVKVFGLSAAALKLVSLLAGTLTIPMIFALGRRVAGNAAGLVAAALAAGSPFLIYYSTEARPYALMVALVLAATLALLRALASGRAIWWVVYALAAAGAAYTHYTSVFALAVLAVWALITQPQARRATALATVGASILYIPELPVLERIGRSPGTSLYGILDPLTLHSSRIDLGRWAIGHPYLPLAEAPGTAGVILIALGGLLALAAGLARLRTARPSSTALLIGGLALATPVGAALYTELHASVWGARNLIASWPALAVGVASLSALAPRPWREATWGLLALGAIAGAFAMLPADHHRPNYADAVALIDRLDPRGAPIVELPAPSPGPPTEAEAAVALAGDRHPVLRLGLAPLAAVLASPPYTVLPAPSGEATARQAAAAAGRGLLFVVAPTTDTIAQLEAARRRHFSSSAGELGHFLSFLGALPARFRAIGAHTWPGLLPVTVYIYRG